MQINPVAHPINEPSLPKPEATPVALAGTRLTPELSPIQPKRFLPASQQAQEILNTLAEEPAFSRLQAKKVRFQVDQESGRMAIQVVNSKTDEVVREIPPENVMRVLDKLRDSMAHLFDHTA